MSTADADELGLGLGADTAALGRSGRTGAVERAVGGVEEGGRDVGDANGFVFSAVARGAGAVGRCDGAVGAAGRAGMVSPAGDAGRMLGGCGRCTGACGGVARTAGGGADEGRGARSVFTAPGGGGRLGNGRDASGRGTGWTPDGRSGIRC
jgi:hypothetical protein